MKISEEKKAMISIIENVGIYLEKISSAKNAIKAGCTNELVKTITGLTDDRIDELRKQLE